MKTIYIIIVGFLFTMVSSCEKMLEIKEPTNTVTSKDVFLSDDQAYHALTGMYTQLTSSALNWSNGYITFLTAYSSDELIENLSGSPMSFVNNNKIYKEMSEILDHVWNSAYKTIYNANALIEGIVEDGGDALSTEAKNDVLGQAYAMRAFAYFYLVNIYENVPLVLTINYNKVLGIKNSGKDDLYERIIKDLTNAESLLSTTYTTNNTARIYINKWFVKGLSARVALYLKDYNKAFAEASDLMNATNVFQLEQDLNNVFSGNSTEVVWRIDFNNAEFNVGNATGEGLNVGFMSLTNELLNSFSNSDKRRMNWISENTQPGTVGYGPSKYKINRFNFEMYGAKNEYVTALRLGEVYLIRAEAAAHLKGALKDTAIADINAIRARADIDLVEPTISDADLLNEIMLERRRELFCEWGHRWFDLKRTGKAAEILSTYQYKQPWDNNQLLYPQPAYDLKWNNNLVPNKGY